MKTALIRFARRIRDTRTGRVLRTIYHTRLIYGLFSRFFKMYFGFTAVVGMEPRRPSERGPAPTADEAELQSTYSSSPVAQENDTFVLYRIIGNDLIPRHRKGQSRENLQFILEHEPDLPGCEKRFILNRIVDPEEEAAIIHLLENHGRPYLRIPFSMDEYAKATWDFQGLPEPGYTLSKQYDTLPDDFRTRLYKRLYRHKNNYLVNNNGARNTALADGKARAKWVLPWDGNCFVTEEAWHELLKEVTTRPWYPYVIVPMARVNDHAPLLQPDFRPVADQEPQVLFRRDAAMSFDEEYYYGRRPKVELLWRLGVPGPWDDWAMEPWDLPYPAYAADAGAWIKAGWVARLPSGNPHLETGTGSETRRLDVRAEAVTAFLLAQDAEILAQSLSDNAALLNLSPPNEDTQSHLASLWTEVEDTLSRKTRRENRWNARRAEQFFLSCRDLPFLLDRAPRGMYHAEAEGLLEWIRTDAGARMVRRRLDTPGTLYDLFTAVLTHRLENYRLLSHCLMHVTDRAAALWGTDAPSSALKALQRLAAACRTEQHET